MIETILQVIALKDGFKVVVKRGSREFFTIYLIGPEQVLYDEFGQEYARFKKASTKK